MESNISPKIVELMEKMLNQLMPRIYPVIRLIEIEGPKTKNFGWITYLNYTVNVYTTIPEEITMDDYWVSDYSDMDFSYFGTHYIDEILGYFNLRPDEFYRSVLVYNINNDLIGDFA